MKSKDKMVVVAREMPEYDGKLWVRVQFQSDGDWVPSFEDLFRILQAIAFCEDRKYPSGQGRFMVRDFAKDACEPLRPGQDLETRWLELREKYKVPERLP